MSDPGDLTATQTISMTGAGRQRLRATALDFDFSHGPFTRVLIAEALDLLEADPAFRSRVTEAVATEKKRYLRS